MNDVKIRNTTPTGKNSPLRRVRMLWSKGTFNAGRNAEKRAANKSPWLTGRMPMLANRRVRQRTPGAL